MELNEENIKESTEKAHKKVKNIQAALSTLNKSSNPYLKDLARQASNDLKRAKESLAYWMDKKEGPWLDKDGYIERGAFEGFYIIPLLEAMANSAKDFPTAMGMIARSVSDKKLLSQSFTMHPDDDPKSKSAYGILIEMAPDAVWNKITSLYWDT